MSRTAYLVLENGAVFSGQYFGEEKEVIGEIVFTTGMTDYMETLTDNNYFGQIIVQTFPLAGNYGVITSDFENAAVSASGYVVKSWCQEPSNFRSEGPLDTFLTSNGVPGLSGIDTRALTRIIRDNGTMNAKITPDAAAADLDALRTYKIINAAAAVSTKAITRFDNGNASNTIAILDFGRSENIKREFLQRGNHVWLLPYDTPAAQLMSLRPDGIILSGGPGDPAGYPDAVENIKTLIGLKIPVFGIGLGHQLLALAHGFAAEKLKYGHRGANQPVKDVSDGRIYITGQNHGYTVVSESVDKAKASEWFVNVNDRTCEGIRYHNAPIFSVQFHPADGFIFDRFMQCIREK